MNQFLLGVILLLLVNPFVFAQEATQQTTVSQPFYSREKVQYTPPINDPIEPVNRSIGFVNHAIMRGIIDPTARVYRLLLPKPVRTCVNNAGDNLAFPVRLVNNLLQAQFEGAGRETSRFAINTTVGILGLFDRASDWGYEPSIEDTGLTFGSWGWRSQMYLMLPLFGPSSERDLVGRVGDTLLSPTTYIPGSGLVFTYNRLSDEVLTYRQLTTAEYDPYALARDLKSFARLEPDQTAPISPVGFDESALQTIQSLRFRPVKDDFFLKMKTRRVNLSWTGEIFPYSVRMQKEPADVVFILPGLGGHRIESTSLALAELFYEHGYSVVTISSTMNWEFILKGANAPTPGYPPADTYDVVLVLNAILEDLTVEYPGKVQRKILTGISLGGFQALWIAGTEPYRKQNIGNFDTYFAIQPPIDLIYAMSQLDRFFNAPVLWPAENRQNLMEQAVLKAATLFDNDRRQTKGPDLTFSEAAYLIGLRFRLALRDVIHAAQSKSPNPIIQSSLGKMNRRQAYAEIEQYSYQDYWDHFVRPMIKQHYKNADETTLLKDGDLKPFGNSLVQNHKVRILTTVNDFLLAPEDLQWLKQSFDSNRLYLFPEGGHLGCLWREEVQERMLQAITSPDQIPRSMSSIN